MHGAGAGGRIEVVGLFDPSWYNRRWNNGSLTWEGLPTFHSLYP